MGNTIIEHIERDRAADLARWYSIPLPAASWLTPDGKAWTPQEVIRGFNPGHSDRWAWLHLHHWITTGAVQVRHIELPTEMLAQKPSDPVWQFIAEMDADNSPEFEPWVDGGRADMAIDIGDGGPTLFVEFGSCKPMKFAMCIGGSGNDWMIVPYQCKYAFVFTPVDPPLLKRRF
jgi:hypothetical protein